MDTQEIDEYGYKAFYNGKSIEVHARGTWEAKQKAIKIFNSPKSKEYLVHVVLCERPDGSTVTHQPGELP